MPLLYMYVCVWQQLIIYSYTQLLLYGLNYVCYVVVIEYPLNYVSFNYACVSKYPCIIIHYITLLLYGFNHVFDGVLRFVSGLSALHSGYVCLIGGMLASGGRHYKHV